MPRNSIVYDSLLSVGRLPEDVEQLERLNSAMSNLATDNDRDVAGEARAVNDLFKRTPVRIAFPHALSALLQTE